MPACKVCGKLPAITLSDRCTMHVQQSTSCTPDAGRLAQVQLQHTDAGIWLRSPACGLMHELACQRSVCTLSWSSGPPDALQGLLCTAEVSTGQDH